MRERTNDTDKVRDREIRSSDIPNAHAVGDGAMGRNDEKLDDVKEDKDETRDKQSFDQTSY